MIGGRGRKLASGKEEMGAGGFPGGMPRQGEGVAAGKGHVFQGEFMGLRRHFIAQDHVGPGGAAEIRHREILGADRFAEPAKAAAVDQKIGLALALDDGGVVVDLPGVLSGIRPEVFQVGAYLDALEALAVQAPVCLRGRLARGIPRCRIGGRHPWRGVDSHKRREEPRLVRALLFPTRRGRYLLEEAVDGGRRPPPFGGVHDRGRAAVFFGKPPGEDTLPLRQSGRQGRREIDARVRCAGVVEADIDRIGIPADIFEGFRIDGNANVGRYPQRGQRGGFVRDHLPGQQGGIQIQKIAAQGVPGSNDLHRVTFARQIPGRGQAA